MIRIFYVTVLLSVLKRQVQYIDVVKRHLNIIDGESMIFTTYI